MAPSLPVQDASGPLKGLRVLDFGAFVAGSYNAVMMGDLGAEVIKIEPLGGDPARQVGPFVAGESRIFVGWNRNKRSLAIDSRTEAGREIIYKLVSGADVVTGNFRPGVAEKLKLDYETLSKINPRLIFCMSTGFGSKGPLRDRPSYDAIFQSMGGVAHGNEATTGKIAVAAPVFIDIQTAMLALSAILAALYHRERTGEGQKVETSLLQGVMSVQPHTYCRPLDKEEDAFLGAHPYGLYDTKDGKIFVAASPHLKFFQRFCEALGGPPWADDPRYQTNGGRLEHSTELDEHIRPLMLEKETEEWERILVDAGVPCGVVYTAEEFHNHPQVEALGMNPIIEHPSVGRVQVYGVPFDFEKTPGRIQRPAPRLGEHTREILGEIGISVDRIDELDRDGVINILK